MTPERWRCVNEIFHAALEQPPSRTEEFLQSACANDPKLYAEVRRMILEHQRGGFLDQPPWPIAPEAAFADDEVLAGRYRIVRFLNRGGMGEVYEAEDLELHERVALKTLLPEIASDGRMIARFKQEIQLSRRISNPNVCRVFDLARHGGSGSSPDAVYFLTMELLAGETLSQRLRREGAMLGALAIPLLCQVAGALDAAHDSGVIHRDLKPSNIMLAPGSGGLRAVVTDFGLARSFAEGENTASRSSRLMGTFEYMAPELFAGRAASVASDIYALGMVAARMLTGPTPPDAGESLHAPHAELDTAWDRAIRRATDPRPENRFTTAGDFARALNGGRSVVLRLPRATRRAVVAGSIAFCTLGAAAGGWWGARHSRRAPAAEATSFYRKGEADIEAGAYFAATRALGEAVRVAPDYALAHARIAEAWVELQTPERASREMLLARRGDLSNLAATERLQIEAIDLTITREYAAAAAKYEELSKQAGTAADIDLGRAYEKAGRQSDAIERYRRAAEGPGHNPAAWLRLAVLFSRRGVPDKAAEAFLRAEELYMLESNLEGLTQLEFERGTDANRRNQFEEGRAHLQKAVETARLARNAQQEINATLQLATGASRRGDASLAEQYAKEGIAIAQSNQMENLAIVGIVNLGSAYRLRRDFAAAEKCFQDGLAMARRSDAYRMAATCNFMLASLHDQLQHSDEAAREARQALPFYQANGYAAESAGCWMMIGRNQRDRGDFAGALASFGQVLQISEKAQDRAGVASAHASIGTLLATQERYPEALEHFQIELNTAVDAGTKGYAGLQTGDLLWRLGRYEEARGILQKAEDAAAKFDALRLKLIRAGAEMALSQGRFSGSAAAARRILKEAREDVALKAEAERILGLALLGSGNKAAGRRNCEEALAALSKLSDSTELLRARIAVLMSRVEMGDRGPALKVFEEIRPALAARPESRWRVFAVMAKVDRQFAVQARQALEELSPLWREAAYKSYLARPDIEILSRPVLTTNSATH